MKKFYALALMIMYTVTLSVAASLIAGDGANVIPEDIKIVKLGTCNGSNADTIGTGEAIIYGPYSIAPDRKSPGYKAIRLYAAKASIGAGDSLQFAYQIVDGKSASDTIVSGWTAVDTLAGVNGEVGTYASIDSIMGRSILFRLLSLDASTVTVAKPIRVYLKENSTAYFNRK